MTKPNTSVASEELRRKVRRIFTGRTHKFPDKKVVIEQTPETRNQKFILTPYEPTVEKIVALAEAYTASAVEQAEAITYDIAFKDGINYATLSKAKEEA